jgi:hypothetical protein
MRRRFFSTTRKQSYLGRVAFDVLCRRIPTLAAKNAARMGNSKTSLKGSAIRTVNLKSDMPLVPEALQRLERELALARKERVMMVKIIHGYGSSGAGGEIRIAVQKRLHELAEGKQIRGCIFGENWSKSDEETWRLLQAQPAVKSDADLGRRNQGITIVLL